MTILGKKLVLLVEDLPFDTMFTLRALEKFKGKFDILTVRDGWDALVVMKRQRFDLILLDLKMPRIDGFQTMALMNGYQLQRNVPIVILSNSNLEEDQRLARERGATAYVHKSVELSAFEASLQATIERHGWI